MTIFVIAIQRNMGKKDSKKKAAVKKVSYHYKPSNMTLEEWQVGLRRQIAEKKCWLKKNNRRVSKSVPAYTSVYLSYRNGRKVCLRIGTDHDEEFKELAIPYFGEDGVMLPQAIHTIMDFLSRAAQIDDTFRCYPDALNFIIEEQDARSREKLLASTISDDVLDRLLNVRLFPYQKEGVRFAFRAGKAIIADEMGLGKTIQAIGVAELMRQYYHRSSALIVCPTSLKYQWKNEIERFTDTDAVVVEGDPLVRKKLYEAKEFYKIVSYNAVCNDIKYLKKLQTDFLIMDEVQRLKNWNTQISKAARRIESDYAVVLSGTPLENKLEELYSIVEFVDPYCLGPYYQFMDQTVVKSETGKVVGYKNLNEVGKQLERVLIRRRKKDVALQLPGRMDKVLFVPMTEQQRSIHEEFQSCVAQLVYKWTKMRFLSEKDRKRLLLMLCQMRMVCDSTYILDKKTRHDTKVEEAVNILKNVFESGNEKVVLFSQWERMLSTLNFKSSLFEGILDNGNDEIFLEDSKFDKIMEDIQVMTDVEEVTQSDLSGSEVKPDDLEEKATEGVAGKTTDKATGFLLPDDNSPGENEPKEAREDVPENLLQQGISFFSGWARTLESPESTRKLVDTIVKEDPETGQARLSIPVPDKKVLKVS